jgi:hypothetical protein
MVTIRWKGFLAVVVVLLVCCNRDDRVPEGAIYILPGASAPTSTRGLGEFGSEYSIDSPDFDAAIKQTANALEAQGWAPLHGSWEDESVITSYVDGWGCLPPAMSFQWLSDWRNSNGDVVTYDFRTPVDIRTRRSGDLRVRITVVPARIASGAADQKIARGEPLLEIGADCHRLLESQDLQNRLSGSRTGAQ